MALDTGAALAEPQAALALDQRALGAYLADALPERWSCTGAAPRVRAFAHGQSNPTYLVEAPGGSGPRVVLRKKPPGRLLPSAHAVEREYAVLAALAAAGGVPVPRPLALCEDTRVLGTPFYVMEFAAGTVFTDPNMPGAAPEARAAAYGALADTLAALHRVDPGTAGLAGFGDPRAYCARQVERWARQYDAASVAPCGRVGCLVAWLRAHVPACDAAPPRPAIVHGDFRLDNAVFGPRLEVGAQRSCGQGEGGGGVSACRAAQGTRVPPAAAPGAARLLLGTAPLAAPRTSIP